MATTDEYDQKFNLEAATAHARIASVVLDSLDQLGTSVSMPNLYVSWAQPYRHPDDVTEATQAEDKEAALAWLREMVPIAKRFGKVEKRSDDWSFGIEVKHPTRSYLTLFSATVPTSVTCDIVETGEVEMVEEERTIREAETMKVLVEKSVTKKVCPPSILAGVLDEVTV